MPTWTTFSLFLLAALGLVFIPGPAVLFVMTRSVDQGRGVGVISSLGIGAADLIHTTAAAFGLSAPRDAQQDDSKRAEKETHVLSP